MVRNAKINRPGAIVVLLAVCLIAIIGLMALAIDIGMIAVERNQAQNAADAAAMAGARALDGSPSSNLVNAAAIAKQVATSNQVLGSNVQASELVDPQTGNSSVIFGAYHYDPATQTFSPQYPPNPPDNYTVCNVTVYPSRSAAFSQVFGVTSLNVSATATAAHRPVDLAIILDYSGSMNNESDLWNNESYLGSSVNNSPNNTDPNFPQWGHYASANASMQCTSSDPQVGLCNISQSILGVPPLVNDFYQQNRGVTPYVSAFVPAPISVTNTAPGGDVPPSGQTVTAITGGGTFTGYPGFKGYTQGPGYWGKTFFIWPPDPNPANDWRKKFFFKSDGVTPCNDDTALFGNDTNGNNNAVDPITGNPVNPICLPQNGRWVVNYAAILNWIQNTGTNPFPAQLRAGRILYYSSIPATIPNLPYDQITNQDQRFWKEYIDFALGTWQDPYGNVRYPGTPPMSYGPDFVWGNVKVTGPDNNTKTSSFGTWIDPMENPPRPRHRFWFGPMTMIQYMLDTGLLPGNSHDISMFPAKIGISGALTDIQNNHPNDMVSMVLFNHPLYTSEYGGGPTPPEAGAFPQAQFSSSRNFTAMINALWFPPNSSVIDVRPWDTNGLQTPRAHGDYNANTATSYGFMLAYNQFSGAASLRAGSNGGLGRTGAQKLVILETDGMYNIHSTPVNGFSNNGVNQSFYRILPGDPINASGADYNALYQIVQAICNDNKGNAGNLPGYSPNPKYPGYSTPTAPVTVHCLVFGTIFEPSAPSGPGTIQTATVQMVQTISQIGGTVFPSSSTDPINGYKWVIGDLTTRETKMRQAFDKIVDQGIPVSLIR